MPLYRSRNSPYWQIRFELAGVEVRRSSGTRDRRAAQELEEQLRADTWRQLQLGERRWTWEDAVGKARLEDSSQRSWKRTEQCIAVLNEYFEGSQLSEITYEELLKVRSLLELRPVAGHGWKTKKCWSKSTVNRTLAVAGSILQRAASDKWGRMIPNAPSIPLFELEKGERRWLTREQAHRLLGELPAHSRDMALFALATGLRKSNVAEIPWERIDLERRCCYVPGYETKGGEPIPVPLNADALTVLKGWKGKHPVYVFCFRGRAPVKRLTTRAWHEAAKAAGLLGVTFHTMRHTWASWQVQTETPLRMLQALGGWADLQMPQRYGHLDPGHLAQYADRTLLHKNDPDEPGKADEQE